MSKPITEPLFKRVLRDPLFHFLILGGLIFAAVSLWGGGIKPQGEILITRAGQQHLADLFELTWQRKPNTSELKNLVEEHIKEEVYYREALALGLDDNDTIVRRRLRQKLEFMQEDLSSMTPPTQAELQNFFNARRDQYTTDHIFSFRQIVVSPKKLGAADNAVVEALRKLNSDETPVTISRSSLLPIAMNLETERSISNTFGDKFTDQISASPLSKWSGPIYSGFGTHLVNVSLNQKAKPLTFEQAKNKASIDYVQSQREQAAANYYKNLRSQYRITVIEVQ